MKQIINIQMSLWDVLNVPQPRTSAVHEERHIAVPEWRYRAVAHL